MNMEQRDTYHCEDSKDVLFWYKLFFIVLDDISKTLIALFHNYARKIILIFDKIYDSHNHWVIDSSEATYFSFSCPYYLAFLI
jgi:hypothetical protein